MLPSKLLRRESIGQHWGKMTGTLDGKTAFFQQTILSVGDHFPFISFPVFVGLIRTMDTLSTSNPLRAHIVPVPGHFSALGHSRSGGV